MTKWTLAFILSCGWAGLALLVFWLGGINVTTEDVYQKLREQQAEIAALKTSLGEQRSENTHVLHRVIDFCQDGTIRDLEDVERAFLAECMVDGSYKRWLDSREMRKRLRDIGRQSQ